MMKVLKDVFGFVLKIFYNEGYTAAHHERLYQYRNPKRV